jgi:hypothetical protein
LSVHTLPAWYDVDDAPALEVLHAELCAGIAFATDLTPYCAPNTATLLRTLTEGGDLLERLHKTHACVVERAAE